jgi:uncharacterized protein (DUF488 family)
MTNTIFTIGHSTRPIDQFIEILWSFDITGVVDVRTVPRSRTNPAYNLDTLPETLAQHGIAHYQIAALGGLRKKSKTVADETNAFWDNRSFHNYADYALTDEFEIGLLELLRLSEQRCNVIMCSEAVWWRCHRRIVADYLLVRGVDVHHIMDRGKATLAQLTPSAVPWGDGLKLVYPRAVVS